MALSYRMMYIVVSMIDDIHGTVYHNGCDTGSDTLRLYGGYGYEESKKARYLFCIYFLLRRQFVSWFVHIFLYHARNRMTPHIV